MPVGDGKYLNAPTTFDTRDEADLWLDMQRTDLVRRTWGVQSASHESVGEYVARWITQHPTAKTSTRELYASILESCIRPGLGQVLLSELTPVIVRTWHYELGVTLKAAALERREGGLRRGNVHSTASVRDGSTRQARAYQVLRAAMNTAVADELIQRNPCRIRGASTPRSSLQQTENDLASRLLSADQVAAVAAAVPGRYRALILTAVWSGLRQRELLGLRRSDLHLQGSNPMLNVRRRVRRSNSGVVDIDIPKTRASIRDVAVPPPVAEGLLIHLDTYCAEGADVGVFTTQFGSVPARGNLTAMLHRAVERCGLPQIRFHDLRHVAQVLAAEHGATTAELMQRMGHASPAAAQMYMHSRTSRQTELAARLGSDMREAGHGDRSPNLR